MERESKLANIAKLFGNHFIGIDELRRYSAKVDISVPICAPEIPWDWKTLSVKSADHLLVLGASQMSDGSPLNLLSLRKHFGIDPDKSQPCFYNQDWFLNEQFASRQLECKWNLICTSLEDASRGRNPETLSKDFTFPSAIACTFIFFLAWFHFSKILWEHEFVWCDDVDNNGDRIYVGKYNDTAGINRSGFSIHRHLTLREYHGCVRFN